MPSAEQLDRDAAENPATFIHRALTGEIGILRAYPDGPEEWIIEKTAHDKEFGGHIVKGAAALLSQVSVTGLTSLSSTRYWERFFRVLRGLAPDEALADELTRIEPSARRLFFVLRESMSSDPYRQFLLALAGHQFNDRHADLWWQICELSDDMPRDYLAAALRGVDQMPSPSVLTSGKRLMRALIKCQIALDARASDGEITPGQATSEFVNLARPWLIRIDDELILSSLRGELSVMSTEAFDRWRKVVPRLRNGRRGNDAAKRSDQLDAWARKATELSSKLREQRPPLEDARRLVSDQEAHFASTGSSRELSLTLTNFARSSQGNVSEVSLEWARRAIEVAPWDHYTWSVHCSSLLVSRDYHGAMASALEAARRFPQISTIANQLGHVLMRNRMLREAEAAYRESLVLFPEDPHAWGGLAEVAKHDRRLDEAEQIYRDGLDLFHDNDVLMTGLASTLRVSGKNRLERDSLLATVLKNMPNNGRARAERERPWFTDAAAVTDVEEPAPAESNERLRKFGDRNGIAALALSSSLRRWSTYSTGSHRDDLLGRARVALEAVPDDVSPVVGECEAALLSLERSGSSAQADRQLLDIAESRPGYLKAQWAVLRAARMSFDPHLQSAERSVSTRMSKIGAATSDLLVVTQVGAETEKTPDFHPYFPREASRASSPEFKSWWRRQVIRLQGESPQGLSRNARLYALEEILVNRASLALAA